MRVALAVACLLAVAGCGSPAPGGVATSPTPTPTPETFNVAGTMTIKSEPLPSGAHGAEPCSGGSGYDDVTIGTQVTVYDANGRAVALGALEAGVVDSVSEYCEMKFWIADVPRSSGLYSVQVAHRGKVQFTEANALQVTLTLG